MVFRLLLLSILFSTTLFSQQIKQTYRNPVIPGDFPDPTVIRVGTDYYAAGTTSDFAPNYPLYHSVDLINWKRIGSVFNNPPEWVAGSCWAPELFYNKGVYYVYYTAKRKTDNVSCIGVATTKDIEQGFTDHGIIVEWGNEAIDAFVFKDDDGKLYISWKAYGLDNTRKIEILASELSPDGLSLAGTHFSLTQHDKGWIGRGDEGQCMVKHGIYYYLLYSIGGCCDNKCDYNVRVARSESLYGPWEQYEKSPLLEGGENWKCPGHGTLVETPDGRYFYLYHAYNLSDFEFVGRQGLLDELLWDDSSGWPYFKLGNTPSSQSEVSFRNTVQNRETLFYDNFTSDVKKSWWQWDMKLSEPLRFKGISPQTGNYTMETKIMTENEGLRGLSVYGDKSNWLFWGISGSELTLIQCRDGERIILFKQSLNSMPVSLKMVSVNGRMFKVCWSFDQAKWDSFQEPAGHIDGSFLPRWGVGLRSGLMTEKLPVNSDVFSYFSLQNNY